MGDSLKSVDKLYSIDKAIKENMIVTIDYSTLKRKQENLTSIPSPNS